MKPPGIQTLTGYTAEELLGRNPDDVLQGPKTDPHTAARIRAAIHAGNGFEATLFNYTKTGQAYWAQISCIPINKADGGHDGFISTTVDATALRRLSDFNTLPAEVNQAVAASDTDRTLLQSICDLAIQHTNLELAWIGKPDESARIQFLAQSGPALAYLENFYISTNPQIPEGQGPTGQCWQSQKPIYSQSFASTPGLKPWQELARSFGLDASATQPIFRGGKIWAVFSVYHARSSVFDEDLRTLLNALAQDISNGLDRIDLLHRERQLAVAQRQLSAQLYEEKELAYTTLSSVGDGVITTDVFGRVTFLNPVARELSGWQSSQSIGRPVTSVLHLIDGMTRMPMGSPVERVLGTGKVVNLGNDSLLVARDGVERHIGLSAAPIFTQEGDLRGSILVFRDMTQKHEAQQRLQWQATHDSLTGLPNRYALEQRLDAAIENARQKGSHIAVGFLDLDDFKPVNDAYGHAIGDLLLKELATRVQTCVRDCDMLARLGGDELVVVFDDIDPTQERATLDVMLSRLHEAVDTPFTLTPDVKVAIGMSMGIAIYPTDGEDADGLLRQADAAMYAAKANRFNRSSWWRPAALTLPQNHQEETIDAYGDIAEELLKKTIPFWEGLEAEFVEAFYGRLHKIPSASRILDLLSPSELAHLKARQQQHFKRLISPDLRSAEHEKVAMHIGEVHAMIGVEASDIMAAIDDYGHLLRLAGQRLPWRIDARLALDSILQTRLAREIQNQGKGRDLIEQGRISHLVHLEREMLSWAETGSFAEQLVLHFSEMQCICGVGVGRPDADDRFVLEFVAGRTAGYLADMQREDVALTSSTKTSTELWRLAWGIGQIQISHSEILEAAVENHAAIAEQHGIRSAVAIPILDGQDHPMVVVLLHGIYPGQFSTALMRMWLESVQHLITPVFQRLERGLATKTPLDTLTRQRLRALLFDDQLQIMIQPIVTLRTGAVDKVEVLARLRDGDQLVSPARFLPAFGQQDLQVLFLKGLRQILEWLEAWGAQGIHVDASINLPPSVLISPDCPKWIDEALHMHRIAPSRLYLELLETEDDALNAARRDAAVSQLAALGVRLVMDDLGSGYSSLVRLRTLPFHTVKIDQELVKQAAYDPHQTVPFVGSLVSMAQTLGLNVVIEGLETNDLVEMASGLGAEYGQGYALARPFLPEKFEDWVKQSRVPSWTTRCDTELGKFALGFRGRSDALDLALGGAALKQRPDGGL